MFAMIGGRRGRPIPIPIAALVCCLAAPGAGAQALDLEAAERVALDRDAGTAALAERRRALQEDAVAAAQLPDPQLRLGALNLPTDSFALDQEPMTQVQLGLRQQFPRGQTRGLSRDRAETLAAAENARADARRREVVRSLRRAWTERASVSESLEILRDQQLWFAQLEESVTAAYAAGRRPQHDLLRIAMERDLLDEEAVRLRQMAMDRDAELARWLGPAADQADVGRLPVLPVPGEDAAAESLARHPLILAELERVAAGEIGVELARQAYRPAFAVDLAYGFRDGQDSDGDSRPDFVSAMLSFELPLFPKRRQDRTLASASAREQELRSGLKDLQRELRQRFDAASSELGSLRERMTLFEQRVMPAAEATVEATRQAYRNDVAPFDELVRAEKTLLDARTRLLRLRTERLLARADLLYLTGDTP
jgi:outer membrane protein TolC